jgi:WD40 repeat protein/tetratricopeptide (TPR) repeat protein
MPPGDAQTSMQPASSETPTEPARPASNHALRVRYFGDYELIQEIARGGMGIVYRARQVSLNRPVALKMILAGQLASEQDVARFRLEAEAAANLDHAGIVPIYEIGEHEGQQYFSMGFVEGTSLAARVAEGPLPPREAAELVRQVCEAVQYAHERGVIHRDLKPANVLLDAQGRPKVTDFGLAKKLQSDSGLTQTGQVMGTPSYMPPEQAAGNNVGPAADVYALGAVLYCLLTGRPPFQAANSMDTLLQVINQEPVAVRQLNATVPRDLETITLKALQKEPIKRYASAAALGDDLQRFLKGEAITARPVGRVEKAAKWARRHKAVAGLGASLAVLLTAASTLSTWAAWKFDQQARRERQVALSEQTQRKRADQLADEARRIAASEREARTLVEEKSAESLQRHVSQVLASAHRAMEASDWGAALPWLAEALRIDPHHPSRGPLHRARIATHLRSIPRLLAVVAGEPSVGRLVMPENSTRMHRLDGRQLQWFDLSNGTSGVQTLRFPEDAGPIAVSEDGRLAVALCPVRGGDPDVPEFELVTWDVAEERVVGEPLRTKWRPDDRFAIVPGTRRVLGTRVESPTLCLWDLDARSEVVMSLRRDEGDTRRYVTLSLPMSSDGRRLAIGSFSANMGAVGLGSEPVQKMLVHVYDANTGRELATLPVNGFSIALQFTPDGSRLITLDLGRFVGGGRVGGTIQVWDVETGASLISLDHGDGMGGMVHGFRITPDGRRLISQGVRDVRFWDLATGQPVGEPLVVAAYDLSLSPDGERLAVLSSGAAQVWDLATRATITPRLRQGIAVQFVRFAQDGRLLVTAGVSGNDGRGRLEARAWDLTGLSDPALRELKGRWSSDNGRLQISSILSRKSSEASAPRERRFLRIHGPDGQPFAQELDWPGSGPPKIVLVSDDGRRLMAVPAGSAGRALHVYDLVDGRAHPVREHPGRIWRAALSADGRYAVAAYGAEADDARLALLWDLEAGTSRRLGTDPSRPLGHLGFSPDSRRLVTMQAGMARLWDPSTGEPIGPAIETAVDPKWLNDRLREASPMFPGCVAFSGNGRILALTIGTPEIHLINLEDGRPLPGSPISAEAPVHQVALDELGGRIAAGLEGGNVRVFRWPEGRAVGRRVSLDGAPLESLAISPDGLVVALYDGRKAVPIEVDSGVPLGPPVALGRLRRAFRFAGNGLVLAEIQGQGLVAWEFAPDERPAETLRTLSEMVAGRVVDDYGQETGVSSDLSARVWAAARGREPETPSEPADPPQQWHSRLAEEAEEGYRYFSAVFHLSRLVDAKPEDPVLRKRRGEMRAELGDLAKAEADFAAAAARWPENRQVALSLGLLRARLGDAEGHHAACNLMDRVQRTPADRPVEELSLLGLRAGSTRPLLEHRLEELNTRVDTNGSYNYLAALGVARLRLGYAAEAVADLRRAIVAYGQEMARAPMHRKSGDGARPAQKPEEVAPDRDEGTPRDWIHLALAERALGHEETARAWANKANGWLRAARTQPDHPMVAGAFSDPVNRAVIRSLKGDTMGSVREGKRSADLVYYPSWRELIEIELLCQEFQNNPPRSTTGTPE